METTTRELEADLFVITLCGRWDAQSSPMVEKAVFEHIKTDNRVVLNLSQVSYMSSSALRTLLLLSREIEACCNCRLVLAAVPQRLQDVMDMTGFIEHFNLQPTVEASVAALRA